MNVTGRQTAPPGGKRYTLGEMAQSVGRSALVLGGIQKRFALPVFAQDGYSAAYVDLMRKIVQLRILHIAEESILKLWNLEKKLLILLNVDTEKSPTWFLDACGKRSFPRRRLLLTNFDTGTDLFKRTLQPLLPMRSRDEELFAGHEMGENVMRVLSDYLDAYEQIRAAAVDQIKPVRAAATWANRLPPILRAAERRDN